MPFMNATMRMSLGQVSFEKVPMTESMAQVFVQMKTAARSLTSLSSSSEPKQLSAFSCSWS